MLLKSGTPARMCVCGWGPLTQPRRLLGSMTRQLWPSRAPTPASTSLRGRPLPQGSPPDSVLLVRWASLHCQSALPQALLHQTLLHDISLQQSPRHQTPLHQTLLHQTLLHQTLLHQMLLHQTLLHQTLLHDISLHWTSKHQTSQHHCCIRYCCYKALPHQALLHQPSLWLRSSSTEYYCQSSLTHYAVDVDRQCLCWMLAVAQAILCMICMCA